MTGLCSPPPSRNASITRRSTSTGCRTVIMPSAQPPTTLAVSSPTAAPNSGGICLGQAPQAGTVHVDVPAMGHLVPAQERADHLDALEQPRVAVGLGRPWIPGDVLVQRLAGPSAAQKRPGNSSPSVAIA